MFTLLYSGCFFDNISTLAEMMFSDAGLNCFHDFCWPWIKDRIFDWDWSLLISLQFRLWSIINSLSSLNQTAVLAYQLFALSLASISSSWGKISCPLKQPMCLSQVSVLNGAAPRRVLSLAFCSWVSYSCLVLRFTYSQENRQFETTIRLSLEDVSCVNLFRFLLSV